MRVSAQYAEEHFGDILHAANEGQEIEIELSGRSTLLLCRLSDATPFKRASPRILGEGVGEMVVPSWEEWKAVDREIEREVNDHPLIPGGL